MQLRVTETADGWSVINAFDSGDKWSSEDVITRDTSVTLDVTATNTICVTKSDGSVVGTCGTTGTVTTEMDSDLTIACQADCGHGSFRLLRGDKMPGGAGIAAGFVIGVIFTVVFCATIYYYQSRDQKRQKEQATAQPNQLAEATKKAIEATSPTTQHHLQQAVTVQAGHPNSPNNQQPIPLSPNMILVQAGTPQQPQMMMAAPMQSQPMQMGGGMQ